MSKTGFRIACLVGMIGFVTPVLTPVLATEQVYHPISPTLGGNPSNGTFLLSTAQAQGEGVNSGNNGPTINFPAINTGGTGGNSGTGGSSGTSGSSGNNGSTGAANASFRQNLNANPLGAPSGRF
jgi:curli production assembly/transport component CsgF